MRVVMMGSGLFAEPTFDALLAGEHAVVGLFTQPDRAVGAERGSTRQTGRGMKAIAQQHGVPVFQPENVNTPEAVASLRALAPDVMVVAAYGQLLRAAVRESAPHGAVNVHASLLPRYRGAAPVAWALYHGETRTGVTIFRIAAGMDSGRMLVQEAIDIGPDETAGQVEARLAPLGARLVLEVLGQLEAGTAVETLQDDSLATKAPKLTKEHGAIDWSRTGHQVCCQVRAMHPWPTPYTFWHRTGQASQRLIVHKATWRPRKEGESVAPGELLLGDPARLEVGAGGGDVVEVLELQPAGKRRMTAQEYLRGHRPQAGDRLGKAEG
jgi:methionyl-tRNA formyltransferase